MNKKIEVKMKLITFYILIFITVLSCNYQRKEEIEENIVAKVNNDFLTLEELRSNFTEDRWNELTLDEKKEFINDWIQLSLLAQESERLKLDKRMEIESRIKTAEKTVKSNALIAQKISEIVITEDDLFNYYKLHKSKFQKKTKEFRVQRIFIKKKSKLDSVLVNIKNGLPFTEAAKMYSEEKIGAEGGYTGFLTKKKMEKTVWDKLNDLNKWYYTSIKINNGYYIMRYYETRYVDITKDFIEVRNQIREIVFENKRKKIYENLIKDLKNRAEITISI